MYIWLLGRGIELAAKTIVFHDFVLKSCILTSRRTTTMSKTSKVSSLIVLAAASIALTFGVAGCNKNNTPDNSAQNQPAQTDQSQNPADTANLAPTDGTQATEIGRAH